VTTRAVLSFSADRMTLSGEIDFVSAIPVMRQGETWLRESAPSDSRLDMAGVTRCNSAATALLLGWFRAARAAGKSLAIEHPPESVVSLMQLAGLAPILREHTADNE
jgi:phospholipid transport system transporter-binding protein